MTDICLAIDAIMSDTAVSLAAVCDILDVCRSAYYAWRSAEPGLRERERDALTPTIVAIGMEPDGSPTSWPTGGSSVVRDGWPAC